MAHVKIFTTFEAEEDFCGFHIPSMFLLSCIRVGMLCWGIPYYFRSLPTPRPVCRNGHLRVSAPCLGAAPGRLGAWRHEPGTAHTAWLERYTYPSDGCSTRTDRRAAAH
jgi:hypothetical protein